MDELIKNLNEVLAKSKDGFTCYWVGQAIAKLSAASPQVVADEHPELAYTAEEAREQFMDQVRHLVGYWARESHAPTAKEKLEGLAFSLLNIFDGTSGLPAFDIVCAPHPDDKQYHIDEGSKYFVPGMVINDCHLHEILFSGRAAAPVQAQEPIGEVAAQGRFTSNADWFAGYMPPIGTKIYTAPVQPVAVPDDCKYQISLPINGESRWYDIPKNGYDMAEPALRRIVYAAPAAHGDAQGSTDDDYKEGDPGWRPACCDGGGLDSSCCDSGEGCAADCERATIAAKAAS